MQHNNSLTKYAYQYVALTFNPSYILDTRAESERQIRLLVVAVKRMRSKLSQHVQQPQELPCNK